MRKILTLLAMFFMTMAVIAQNSSVISYQAVVRDGQNRLATNEAVSITIRVLDASDAVQYTETENVTTNANGLVSLNIGDGDPTAFAAINWIDAKFQTTINLTNLGYEVTSTTPVTSVPVALYALSSGTSGSGGANIPQTLSISGTTLTISDGNSVELPEGFSGDYNDLTNKPTDVSNFTNDAGYITSAELQALLDRLEALEVPPTVMTSSVTNVTDISATCGGMVTSGGAGVTARGVCWSTSPNPTVSDSHSTNGTGPGVFTSDLTGLTPRTTYYLRAYATNSVGTAYGEQKTFMTNSYCPPTVTDIDGNVYNTVQIGEQCWMRENLKTTKYANGTTIPLGTGISSTTAYRHYPGIDSANVTDYGYLYNWVAVMKGSASSNANPSGVQGICPDGWHVPSDAEWTELTSYVRSQSQYVCGGDEDYIAKALASEEGWDSSTNTCAVGHNPSANNATGFSARHAGDYYGDYYTFGSYAYFWSATQDGSGSAYYRNLGYHNATVYRDTYSKFNGYSVRCVCN